MRNLALSQADGSQAGTEPEFDPIVHCFGVPDTAIAPSPPALPSMALVHAETVENQVVHLDFAAFHQEMDHDESQRYAEDRYPTGAQVHHQSSVEMRIYNSDCQGFEDVVAGGGGPFAFSSYFDLGL